MKVSSVKIGGKTSRRKEHVAKLTAVGASKPSKLSELPTANLDIELDGRRYHIVIEATDFGVSELTDYLQDVVKNKPLR